MTFALDEAVALLHRTPRLLDAWLGGLNEAWTHADDGPGTWSAFDVLGHLVHGEEEDWIPRVRVFLTGDPDATFTPYDPHAPLAPPEAPTVRARLDRFAARRGESLATLTALVTSESALDLRARHPALGPVTLRQMLSAWTVHDLTHTSQIARTMARRWGSDVGPWRSFVRLLERSPGEGGG